MSSRANLDTLRKYREFKENSACILCPETDPVVLEFHHKDPKTKIAAVGALVHDGASWDVVLKEIQKCVVLCSNDHKKVHAGHLKLT